MNQPFDVRSRFIVENVVEDPKFGVPGSTRESIMPPLESRSNMFKPVFGMLTAVVTRFGVMTSVVLLSVIA